MNQNYNQNSFNKGQAFEDFVEQVLFPASHYELLYKTNAYDQNSQRYVGDSRKPDFRFNCILTGFEFHIEAKYRTKPYQGCYDILSPAQVETFPEIHQNKCPVYIALGYGGVANDPAYVSLVPYQEFKEAQILVEDAVAHQIPKQLVNSNLFSRQNEKVIEEPAPTKDLLNQNAQSEQVGVEVKDKIKSQNNSRKLFFYGGLVAVAIGILAAVYFLFLNREVSPEVAMQSRVKNYYALSDANNLEELKKYISPDIEYWYGTKNPSISQVIENIKEYREKYPISQSSVDWTHFDVTPTPDGGYVITYPLEYKVKSKTNAPYRAYDLKLLTTWDEKMRLVSISEIRR